MKNPNHIPSSAWTQSNIEQLFINQLMNKETVITLSNASNGQAINVSATQEQWNKAGVQTDGTQASVTKAAMTNIQSTVRKFVDDFRTTRQTEIERLQAEIDSIHPYKVYSIFIDGKAI